MIWLSRESCAERTACAVASNNAPISTVGDISNRADGLQPIGNAQCGVYQRKLAGVVLLQNFRFLQRSGIDGIDADVYRVGVPVLRRGRWNQDSGEPFAAG